MKTTQFFSFIVCVVAFTGCDSLDRAEFKVAKAACRKDRDRVDQIIRTAAMDAKLSDRISQRRSPSVFAYFYGGDKYFPMMLGARISGDAALIDVARFHGGPGESLLFLNMKRKISSELQSTFGTRVSEVPRGDIVL